MRVPGTIKASLESVMLRKSVGSMEQHRPTCATCGRTPLVGEFIYRVADDTLCGLCVTGLPETDRAPLAGERVRAGERTLTVGPRL
jgi:hypothetical protein